MVFFLYLEGILLVKLIRIQYANLVIDYKLWLIKKRKESVVSAYVIMRMTVIDQDKNDVLIESLQLMAKDYKACLLSCSEPEVLEGTEPHEKVMLWEMADMTYAHQFHNHYMNSPEHILSDCIVLTGLAH